MSFVIYWEKDEDCRGFVSYDNPIGTYQNEYYPCSFMFASTYTKREDAERTRNWYQRRGGFGLFKIMEVR
jgi:hypothetical protein